MNVFHGSPFRLEAVGRGIPFRPGCEAPCCGDLLCGGNTLLHGGHGGTRVSLPILPAGPAQASRRTNFSKISF